MGAKVWYVAAGKRKAGPMTSGRLAKQVSLGKVPDEALAWKEGMDDWEPVHEIERFQVDVAAETVVEEPTPAPAPRARRKPGSKSKVAILEPLPKEAQQAKPKSDRSVKSSKSGTSKTPRPRTPRPTAAEGLSFVPLYRVGFWDMWRAFGLGLEGKRLQLALAATLLPAVGGALIAGLGLLAAQAHMLLAIPFVLVAPIAAYVLGTVGVGALSYYSRHQLQELERPGVQDCLRYALERASAMSLPPFVLALSWLLPLVAIAALALMVKIPVVGPLGTGLFFGVHVTLGASVVFLLMAAGVAGVFGPVVAAFEETGAKATMRLVLDFARRSLVRTGLWSVLPVLALGPFSGVLLMLGLLSLALPLAAVAMACGPETASWIASGGMGDAPYPMVMTMVILIALWVGLVFTALGSAVTSVSNALVSLLYLGGRVGNDELISRDTYLARRAGEEG